MAFKVVDHRPAPDGTYVVTFESENREDLFRGDVFREAIKTANLNGFLNAAVVGEGSIIPYRDGKEVTQLGSGTGPLVFRRTVKCGPVSGVF